MNRSHKRHSSEVSHFLGENKDSITILINDMYKEPSIFMDSILKGIPVTPIFDYSQILFPLNDGKRVLNLSNLPVSLLQFFYNRPSKYLAHSINNIHYEFDHDSLQLLKTSYINYLNSILLAKFNLNTVFIPLTNPQAIHQRYIMLTSFLKPLPDTHPDRVLKMPTLSVPQFDNPVPRKIVYKSIVNSVQSELNTELILSNYNRSLITKLISVSLAHPMSIVWNIETLILCFKEHREVFVNGEKASPFDLIYKDNTWLTKIFDYLGWHLDHWSVSHKIQLLWWIYYTRTNIATIYSPALNLTPDQIKPYITHEDYQPENILVYRWILACGTYPDSFEYIDVPDNVMVTKYWYYRYIVKFNLESLVDSLLAPHLQKFKYTYNYTLIESIYKAWASNSSLWFIPLIDPRKMNYQESLMYILSNMNDLFDRTTQLVSDYELFKRYNINSRNWSWWSRKNLLIKLENIDSDNWLVIKKTGQVVCVSKNYIFTLEYCLKMLDFKDPGSKHNLLIQYNFLADKSSFPSIQNTINNLKRERTLWQGITAHEYVLSSMNHSEIVRFKYAMINIFTIGLILTGWTTEYFYPPIRVSTRNDRRKFFALNNIKLRTVLLTTPKDNILSILNTIQLMDINYKTLFISINGGYLLDELDTIDNYIDITSKKYLGFLFCSTTYAVCRYLLKMNRESFIAEFRKFIDNTDQPPPFEYLAYN